MQLQLPSTSASSPSLHAPIPANRILNPMPATGLKSYVYTKPAPSRWKNPNEERGLSRLSSTLRERVLHTDELDDELRMDVLERIDTKIAAGIAGGRRPSWTAGDKLDLGVRAREAAATAFAQDLSGRSEGGRAAASTAPPGAFAAPVDDPIMERIKASMSTGNMSIAETASPSLPNRATFRKDECWKMNGTSPWAHLRPAASPKGIATGAVGNHLVSLSASDLEGFDSTSLSSNHASAVLAVSAAKESLVTSGASGLGQARGTKSLLRTSLRYHLQV